MVEDDTNAQNGKAQLVDVNYCVVCGSEEIKTLLQKTDSKTISHARCTSCHSQFRCNTRISSDPTTESRSGRGDGA